MVSVLTTRVGGYSMRFRPETLGVLARPRVLTKAIVYTLAGEATEHEQAQNFWQIAKRSTRLERFSVYFKPFKEIFKDLKLGNTESVDLSSCYVGVITHYMVHFHGTFYVVDASNIQEMLVRVRKVYGNRANLKVSYVGLKFYKGMERDSVTGKMTPKDPWEHTGRYIWFYSRKDIVSMDDILRYESAHNGDLVLFPKAKGIVVKHRILNKPKFYKTSSWTCKAITLLNGSIDGFTRFLPDRSFKIRKPSEPLPVEMIQDESDCYSPSSSSSSEEGGKSGTNMS